MGDENKSREELISELTVLRQLLESSGKEAKKQPEFYENVVQYSAAPTFVVDRSHRVVLWNRACEELTGIKAADIVGTDEQWKPFYESRRPVLADLVLDQETGDLARLYASHAPSKFIPEGLQVEGWYPNIDGVERYISFSAAPIRDSAGELIAAVETFEDLTEVKRAETRLVESEKRYRVLFEDSPAVMLIIDPQTAEIVSANEAAFAYYGYSRKELTGKPMTEIITLPAEEVVEALRDTAQGAHYLQFRQRLASGEIRDVELSRGSILVDGKIYLFSVVHDITDRKVAEEAMREGEDKLEAIASLATDAIILIDDQGDVCYWNIAAEKMFGYDSAAMMGRNLEILMPPRFREAHRQGFKRFVASGSGAMVGKVYEVAGLRRDGTEFPVELSISGLQLKGRWHSAGVVRDITGRRNLELQLRQSQKMEAMGTFAGGIAHDFNNLLTVIVGHCTILTMKMVKDDPLLSNVQQVLAAADRAAGLTQSLLAFSRKTPLQTRPANLNDIVDRFEKLLVRLLRADIEVRCSLTGEDLTVMANPGQIEQVLMNLATNARDAMPRGGILWIGTGIVELDREFIRIHGYGTPGRYASITCSDNGVGMDTETAQRIFEPFFTTKEVGKGTGLGLAIVYGIVQQHQGYINCYSEPGKGTSFRIYLPLARQAEGDKAAGTEPALPGGSETILIAEDDAAARSLTRQILETFGYTVIETVDGEDAVRQFRAHRDRIGLVLLDVIMPKKNGREACREIQKLEPEIKCLFTSGYAADIFGEEEKKELNFIPKPIIPTQLLKQIRKILDA